MTASTDTTAETKMVSEIVVSLNLSSFQPKVSFILSLILLTAFMIFSSWKVDRQTIDAAHTL